MDDDRTLHPAGSVTRGDRDAITGYWCDCAGGSADPAECSR